MYVSVSVCVCTCESVCLYVRVLEESGWPEMGAPLQGSESDIL